MLLFFNIMFLNWPRNQSLGNVTRLSLFYQLSVKFQRWSIYKQIFFQKQIAQAHVIFHVDTSLVKKYT